MKPETLKYEARLSGSENHKGFRIRTGKGYVIAQVEPIDEDGKRGEHYARMFAAAPQLLEALKHWHKYGSIDWADDVAMMLFYADCEAKTAAAIRAAEGEE